MATPAVSPRASCAATPLQHSPFGVASPFGAAVAARERAISRGGASPRARDDRTEVPTPPEAKRPIDAASIQVSVPGVRLMSAEDLSSAFFALNGRVERTEGHGANIYETVDFNAMLLCDVCREFADLKTAQAATSVEVGQTVL